MRVSRKWASFSAISQVCVSAVGRTQQRFGQPQQRNTFRCCKRKRIQQVLRGKQGGICRANRIDVAQSTCSRSVAYRCGGNIRLPSADERTALVLVGVAEVGQPAQRFQHLCNPAPAIAELA